MRRRLCLVDEPKSGAILWNYFLPSNGMASISGLRRLPVEIKATNYLQMQVITVLLQVSSAETGNGASRCGNPDKRSN
jgi:hypothetical protein